MILQALKLTLVVYAGAITGEMINTVLHRRPFNLRHTLLSSGVCYGIMILTLLAVHAARVWSKAAF